MGSPGSQAALRAANCERVLRAVRAAGSLTHAEISRSTGLSRASVTNLVRVLEQGKQVAVTEETRAGRRARVVWPTPQPGAIAAIDVGRTHMRVAIASTAQQVLGEREIRTPSEVEAYEGIEVATELLWDVAREAGVQPGDVQAACVGIPGPLDRVTGQVGAGTLMPKWIGLRLDEAFASALQIPVTVENDANLGALGEYTYGNHGQARTMLYVRMTTGIGGGIILNGELFTGESGTAGEIGHLTIDERGEVCRCGNRGCLETYATVPAILETLATRLERDLTVAELVEHTRSGDVTCVRVVEDAGRYLGLAVANLCNLINPGIVVVGGPLAGLGDVLLDPVREAVRRLAIPSAASTVTIQTSRLGRRSEALGALLLAEQAIETPV